MPQDYTPAPPRPPMPQDYTPAPGGQDHPPGRRGPITRARHERDAARKQRDLFKGALESKKWRLHDQLKRTGEERDVALQLGGMYYRGGLGMKQERDAARQQSGVLKDSRERARQEHQRALAQKNQQNRAILDQLGRSRAETQQIAEIHGQDMGRARSAMWDTAHRMERERSASPK